MRAIIKRKLMVGYNRAPAAPIDICNQRLLALRAWYQRSRQRDERHALRRAHNRRRERVISAKAIVRRCARADDGGWRPRALAHYGYFMLGKLRNIRQSERDGRRGSVALYDETAEMLENMLRATRAEMI